MAAVALVGSGTAAVCASPRGVDSLARCVTPGCIEFEVICASPGGVDSLARCVGHVESEVLYVGPEYVDSLKVLLAQREMPEKLIYLPYALADQAADNDRVGLWAIPALDALRWKGLYRAGYASLGTLERGHSRDAVQMDTSAGELSRAEAVPAGTLEGAVTGNRKVKAAPGAADINNGSCSVTDADNGNGTNTVAGSSSSSSSGTGTRNGNDTNTSTDTGTDTDTPTPDIRTDIWISTAITLERLQELHDLLGDWDRAILAYAQSPTAAAAIKDSTALAESGIIRSLREAESRFAHSPAPAAFEGLETLAALRRAERNAQLLAEGAARKARSEKLRSLQAANVDRITYTIRKGDTLGGIAARHKVKVADLKRWNGLKGDFIREGRKLVIYRH